MNCNVTFNWLLSLLLPNHYPVSQKKVRATRSAASECIRYAHGGCPSEQLSSIITQGLNSDRLITVNATQQGLGIGARLHPQLELRTAKVVMHALI